MKEFLITLAWIAGAIVICCVAFFFLMRGAMELAQEFKSFSATTANTPNTQDTVATTSSIDGSSTVNGTSQQNSQNNQLLSGWVTYVSSTNDFTVAFPEAPEIFTYTADDSILTRHKATNESEFFEVDRLTTFRPINGTSFEELQLFIGNLARSQNKQIESVYLDPDAEVVRFTLRGGQGSGVVKGVVVPINEVTLYVLQYGCVEGSCSDTRYNQFISSFTTSR